MKLYRGYNEKYSNYGIPSNQSFIWTTDDEEYAQEYGKVVEFEVDENKLVCAIQSDYDNLENGYEYFDPIEFNEDDASMLRAEGFNCFAFTLDNGSDVYIILDTKLLKTSVKEAGYSGWSKSNNAIEAESENKFPASIAGKKLGVSTEAIKKYIDTSEWHHYSSYYNEIYVYDITPYLMLKNGEDMSEEYSDEEIQQYKKNYQEMKAMSSKKPADEKRYKANVEYIIWTGSRNHPRPIKHSYENIEVIEKGQFYTFKLPNGYYEKKKIGSNGTKVVPMEVIKAKQKKEKEELKQAKERFKEFKKNTSRKALMFIKKNDLDSNSDYNHFYVRGRKSDSYSYLHLDTFLQKGELRLSSKNPNGLSTSGAYLEQWDGQKWVAIEPTNYQDDDKFLSLYYVEKFLNR